MQQLTVRFHTTIFAIPRFSFSLNTEILQRKKTENFNKTDTNVNGEVNKNSYFIRT